MRLTVETVRTLTAGLRPAHFLLGGRRLAVDVVDSWPGENHTYYKVGADDGHTYILRHDTFEDVWELTLYQAGDGEAALRPDGRH